MPSITRSGPSGADRRAAVEAQILAAVGRLLAQGSTYTQISVQRILDEAGIARSTFYAHFRDKSEILSKLAETFRQRLYQFTANWSPEGPDGGLAGLENAFRQIIAFHREHFPVLATFAEVAAYDASVQDFYNSELRDFEANVVGKLRDEQAERRTPADVEAAAAARVIVWGGTRAIEQHIRADDGTGDHSFAAELARIWWYGAFRRPS
ncbi:TetR/AcrR family transcriptional regulator [Phytohabitans flavus]|nr:TetR/AcrR family transcriptional regulator [Phytohabitans flavus]